MGWISFISCPVRLAEETHHCDRPSKGRRTKWPRRWRGRKTWAQVVCWGSSIPLSVPRGSLGSLSLTGVSTTRSHSLLWTRTASFHGQSRPLLLSHSRLRFGSEFFSSSFAFLPFLKKVEANIIHGVKRGPSTRENQRERDNDSAIHSKKCLISWSHPGQPLGEKPLLIWEAFW